MDLKIEYVDVKDIKPYQHNARMHGEPDVAAICASIREVGFLDPIGIWKDTIVEGHGRLLAAKRLGMGKVPVIRLDHLTDEQRRAYALAHNRTAELSEWNFDILATELDGIFDIDMTQFGFELEDDSPKQVVEDNYDVVLPEVAKALPGQIYQLGDHRLICGDATVLSDVEKLLDGEKADLVVTDPPYNMGYEGAGNTKDRKSKRIKNDKMPEKEFEAFLLSVYQNYKEAMKDGASIYSFYKELGNGVFIRKMVEAGLTFKQELIWVKNQLVIGGAKYQNMYEPCVMGCKGRSIKKWNGKRRQRSVIESVDFMDEVELRETVRALTEEVPSDIIREKKPAKNDLHPTMKPIRLLAKLIENSSDEGDVVLDLFGGSGSTLIACEQLGRRCYMSELDTKYVDVIIDRWESFTGRGAVLLTGGLETTDGGNDEQ